MTKAGIVEIVIVSVKSVLVVLSVWGVQTEDWKLVFNFLSKLNGIIRRLYRLYQFYIEIDRLGLINRMGVFNLWKKLKREIQGWFAHITP